MADNINVTLSEDVINVKVDNYLKGVSFINLIDTPSQYNIGKYAKSTTNGIIWDDPSGSGNMTKIVYDANNDGIVDNASNIITKIEAKENLPIYTIITNMGKHADSSDITCLNKIFGITIEEANINLTCKVLTFGYIQNINWNFQKGVTLFLNGPNIKTFPSNTGFVQEIGTALNSNTIYFNLKKAIKL